MRIRVFTFSCFLFFLLISSSFNSTLSKSRQYLKRGASLSVEDDSDFITSPDKSFACGFYGMGRNAYWFAIWFTNSKDRTVVWMANRDRPVNGQGSKVSLRKNGAMVLTDVDGTIVWQTNTSSTDFARAQLWQENTTSTHVIAKAELLDTGNLVLKNPEGKILWQSFDYPTDTLLPWQTFTKSNRLVSASRKGNYASGYFNLYFDSDNVLGMIYDGPQASSIYWPDPDKTVYANGRTNYNSSRIAFLDDIGRFQSSDRLQVSASDEGSVIKRRLTIDYDGNLRIYSLINSTWRVSWQAMGQPCNVHGVCGENAICVYAAERKCSCPPGYEVSDPSDWSKGCKPKFNRSLLNSQEVKFLKLPYTRYFGFDLNYTSNSSSLEACKKLCLGDYRCVAISYRSTGKGQCYTKSRLFSGFRTPSTFSTTYLRIPTSMQTPDPPILTGDNLNCGSNVQEVLIGSPSMYALTNKRMRWAYLYSFSLGLGAVECIFFVLGWWFLFRKHGVPDSIEDGYSMISSQFKRFSYGELVKATKNFKEELGKGGSGAVFKGKLDDERIVAVKRLGDIFQAEEEFQAEISTIGKIYHMNLVRMWGFCSEKKHRLLVYEYVENLSLDKHLFTSNVLGWKQRFEVALGTAKGLAYLHHECLEWVIHCDVKPENILLDDEFQPKIADFGLAKLSQRGGPSSGVSRIRGTKGYMAPEWALNLPITAKVDVYGYGVVLLEMVKGIRLSNWVIDDTNEQEAELTKFVRIVKRKIGSGKDSWVESVVDTRLQGNYNRNQAVTLIEIGLACIEEDKNKRPTMASVVQTLLQCEDETTVHNPDEL